ncbi:MAG: PCMD domain-containing protein [Rikenellaceae bacterium]
MKHYLKFTLIIFIYLVSCTKIEDLSTDNSLKSFEVISHSPQSIIIGEVLISADSIYIPIEYGRYEFPLTLTTKVQEPSGAHIYGLSDNEDIIFDSIDAEPLRFVVSAENGTSRNYYITLIETPLSDSAELFDVVSFNEELLLNDVLIAGEGDNEKLILAIDTQYPLSVTPQFTIAETTTIESYRVAGSTEWLPFNNGNTTISFDNQESRIELYILSESGNTAIWNLGSLLLEFSDIDPTLQINYKELEASLSQQGVSVRSFAIDFETGEITMIIEESEEVTTEFPLEVTLDIITNDWLTVIGESPSMCYTFNSWDDCFSFALLYSERLKATGWSLSIAKYEPAEEPIEIESAEVSNFSCGSSTVAFIFTYDHLTLSTDKPKPKIYDHTHEIHLYYSSYYKPSLSSTSLSEWWAEFDLDITLSNAEQQTQTLRWEATANESGKITQTEIDEVVSSTKYISIDQTDGTSEVWSIILIDDDVVDSSECDILSFEIVSTTPNYISFNDPAYTIDQGASTIYLNIGDYYNFPLTVVAAYDISLYASAEPNTLTFEDEQSEESVTITAQDGTTKSYTIKLIVPQTSEVPTINSITFGELAAGATIIGQPTIDQQNNTITVGIEASNGHFPLEVSVTSIEVADDGYIDIPASGSLTFNSANSSATVWVNSADGTARQIWYIEIFYYEQITGGDMDSWEMDASPVTSSLPWSTPNMSGIAAVSNTNPVSGYWGQSGDYAADLQTGTSWGQLASGSIFTGWFDKDNSISYGLSDPVRLTHFGTPFNPDATIQGISANVSYAQASTGVDWGSLTVILIAEDPAKAFEFHGDKPNDYDDPTQGGAPHPNNTATAVAISKMIFGNGSATKTSYGDTIDINLESGEWSEIFIPISTDQPFTHISIAAASSAYGDYFLGEAGSVMRLDNVKIIYE